MLWTKNGLLCMTVNFHTHTAFTSIDVRQSTLRSFQRQRPTKWRILHPQCRGRRNQHIVMLSVSHQLHCLDNLRKALHPEYYREEDNPMHLSYEHHIHSLIAFGRASCASPMSLRSHSRGMNTSVMCNTTKRFDILAAISI
jgi:hypothetical protein